MDDLRFFSGSERRARELRTFLDPNRPISREEQEHKFHNALYALYWQAERARKLGISWRKFCVGCSMWAFRADASTYDQRWSVHYGMNTKVVEGSRNICAEPIPLNAAYARACTEIVGMVVVGNPREQDSSQTLHPCEHCRLLMKHHPLIKPHTIIVTALPPPENADPPESMEEIVHEVHTFESLLKQYNEA